MSKVMFRVVLVVVLASVLAIIPAAAQPLMDLQDSTFFPATGDIIQVEHDPYWWEAGDSAQGRRYFQNLPEMGRLIYDMQIDANGLHAGATCDFEFSVNGQPVQQFSVMEGDTSAYFDVGFRTLQGPTYIFTLEQTNTVPDGLGSITIPLDQSGLYLFPPGPCPAAKALSREDDGERLDLLYRFRNELLSPDPALRQRLEVYYANAPEATSILSSHPILLLRTASSLRRAAPLIEALVDGKGDGVSVPAGDLRAAYRLLDDLRSQASPELSAALTDLGALLANFEGRTLSEAWSLIEIS